VHSELLVQLARKVFLEQHLHKAARVQLVNLDLLVQLARKEQPA
jgi:hypothetical protein